MKRKTFDRLLLFALFFTAHWFFGNLYEEIVLAPNNLTNSYGQLSCWQAFFQVTNQIYYYVPFTQIAVFATLFLYLKAINPVERRLLRKASIFGVLALLLTIAIVTQLNVKLFFGDLDRYRDQVHMLSLAWLVGNGIRVILTGTSLFYLFKTCLQRERIIP